MFKDCEQRPLTSSMPSLSRSLTAASQRPKELMGMLCVASLLLVCTEKAMERNHCRIEGFLKNLFQNHVWYFQP